MDERTLDQDAERLFAQHRAGDAAASSDDPALMAFTRFVEELRHAYGSAPDPVTRARHIEAVVRALRGAGVQHSYGNGFSPNGLGSNGSKVRRRRPRRIVVRGAIAAAALVLAGGSAMAATGALPDVAQDAVSRVAKRIGLSLPKGHPTDVLRKDVDPDVQITRVKAGNTDNDEKKKAKAAQVDREPDSSDDDSSDGDGSVSTVTRRPSADSPTRPARPKQPDPDEEEDGGISDGGSAGGRGDPSGDSDGSADPGEEPDGDGGGGGRGDPVDGGSADEPDSDTGSDGAAGGSDAGGSPGGAGP